MKANNGDNRIILFYYFTIFHSNIDIRIRQAELEYALGREELQLLSVVEDIRGLQTHIEKSSMRSNYGRDQSSLYSQIQNGLNMSLCAIIANWGRFGISTSNAKNGIHIDWAFDGEHLYRNDRIIEYNGKFIDSQTEEEFRKLTNTSGKCELVVIRKRSSQQNNQMLLQSQEDNQRLQHRISYLEDQVKELKQCTKEFINVPIQNQNLKQSPTKKGDHVTSISISSSNNNDNEPQIFQRGNFVATIIGGKAIQNSPQRQKSTALDGLTASMNSRSSTKDTLNGYAKVDLQHNPVNLLTFKESQQYIRSTPTISIRKNSSSTKSTSKLPDDCKEINCKNGHICAERYFSHPDSMYEDVS